MSVIDPLGFLGRELIGYVAGCKPDEVDAALADSHHGNHDRVEAAIEVCRELTDQSTPESVHYDISTFDEQAGMSTGNRLRMEVSGQGPQSADADDAVLDADDAVLSPLARVATDIYPALLIPAPPMPGGIADQMTPLQLISASIFQNPATQDVMPAVQTDPLADLVAPGGNAGFVAFANGSGMGIGLDLLANATIGAALARTRLLHATLSLDLLMAELRGVVSDMRSIGNGEPIDLPVAITLQGLEVQPGQRFHLPWGTLLAPSSGIQAALGRALNPSGAIFVTKISSLVATGVAGDSGPPQLPPARRRAFATEIETRIRKTTLSLLLMERESPLCAVATYSVAVTPFFGTGWASSEITPNPRPAMQGALAESDRPSLEASVALVDTHYAPALAIPTRRLSSALMVRHDIEDGLVDAVVALESLFAGTDSGELTFRIGAAIAWLIGSTADERLQIHREVGKLYNLRSKILHRGNAGQEDVSDERDRTVQLGIDAMRALIADHPDLVDEENRGKTIIMRGEGPA